MWGIVFRPRSVFNEFLSVSTFITWLEMTPLTKLQGVVSLTFPELSKIISRKYTMPKTTFMVGILSWKFARVPKAWLWAHIQSFSWKFSSEVRFLQYTNFERISWRACKTLVKQPPGPHHRVYIGIPSLMAAIKSIPMILTCTSKRKRL